MKFCTAFYSFVSCRNMSERGLYIKSLLSKEKKDFYSEDAVNALIRSINILNPGVCVELNTGDKALVLAENTQDVLNPMVLSRFTVRLIRTNAATLCETAYCNKNSRHICRDMSTVIECLKEIN